MTSVVRMNFSHGEYAYHQSVIDNTRAMVKGKDHNAFVNTLQNLMSAPADPNGRPVAIALDTVSHLSHFSDDRPF